MTISLGVITVSGKTDHHMVFRKVDNALYRAKENGRNRTMTAQL
jgi:PleD family two-component response regulator